MVHLSNEIFCIHPQYNKLGCFYNIAAEMTRKANIMVQSAGIVRGAPPSQ
jgi:hypothetical protein